MKDSEKIRYMIGCVIAAAKDDPFCYEAFCALELLYHEYSTAMSREKSEADNV